MPVSPYTPPKSTVIDVVKNEPVRWGRAVWLHLPVFIGLVALAYVTREAWVSELRISGAVAGVSVSALILYFPAHSLHHLSDRAPPWWVDALYYITVVVFLAGLVIEQPNLMVTGAAPTFFMNGAGGIMAIVTEKRRGVRVYISGRRYVFVENRAL